MTVHLVATECKSALFVQQLLYQKINETTLKSTRLLLRRTDLSIELFRHMLLCLWNCCSCYLPHLFAFNDADHVLLLLLLSLVVTNLWFLINSFHIIFITLYPRNSDQNVSFFLFSVSVHLYTCTHAYMCIFDFLKSMGCFIASLKIISQNIMTRCCWKIW